MTPAPLDDAELDRLQALLDALPAPLEPLDASMLDGYLCGVLLQPQAVPAARWLRHVHDVDGRPAPAGVDLAPLHALATRRHAQLDAAIARRQWFDPWVWELDGEEATPSETVLPWVAGFATALELFPELMQRHDKALTEPLAVVYMHLDPDDLEDADALLEEIETLEPPLDLAEAVEGLVRSTLLIADVSRPQAQPARPARPARAPGKTPGRRAPPPRRR
jgi:uncharacterized protein